MRVLITGLPKSGKTTLAGQMGGGRSTDEVMHLGWGEASREVSRWFDKPGSWIIEGVAIPRALRKWLWQHPGQPAPVDRIIYLQTPHQILTDGQMRMGVGLDTVMQEILPWMDIAVEVY